MPHHNPRAIQETPQEQDNRIQALFKTLQPDQDNRLTSAHIHTHLDQFTHHPFGNRYAHELVQLCDTSGDGKIDYPEFKAFMKRKERELLRMFDAIDKTDEGLITANELGDALKGAGIYLPEPEVNQFMEMIDKDNSGTIDFQEWRDFLLFMPKEASIANIYSFFRQTARLGPNGEIFVPIDVNGNDSYMTTVKYFLAGAIAGAVSRTLTAPLDRLRVHLQVNASGGGGSKGGMALVEATKTIYQQGNRSITTFFRGNGLNVVKIAPESAVKFATYEAMKTYLLEKKHASRTGLEKTKADLSVYERLLAGGVAGVCSQGGVYPLEVLKTRVMTASANSEFKGMALLTHTAKEMYKEAGVRAFYRGLMTAVIGVFPFAAIDMAVFDALKQSWARTERKKLRQGEQAKGEPGLVRVLGFGMFSGMIASCAVYPIGLVRTRLQAQGTPAHPQTYTGAMDVVQRTFKREGIKGFYKGLVPTLIKVIPAAGLSYATYEVCKKQMNLK